MPAWQIFRYKLGNDVLARLNQYAADDGRHFLDKRQAGMLQHFMVQRSEIVNNAFNVNVSDGRQLFVQAGSGLQRLFHELKRADFIILSETSIDGNSVSAVMLGGYRG